MSEKRNKRQRQRKKLSKEQLLARNKRILKTWNGRVICDQYDKREDRFITEVTVCDYSIDCRLVLNKYRFPLSDPWLLTSNLFIQPNNDPDLWNDKIESIGYQYLCKYRSPEWYELKRKLIKMVRVLTYGYMKEFINTFCLIRLVKNYIPVSVARFREFYFEWVPEPKLKHPPIDLITSGYMRNIGGVHIDGLHKIVEMYIDVETGMYLQWQTESELVGEEEWIIDG